MRLPDADSYRVGDCLRMRWDKDGRPGIVVLVDGDWLLVIRGTGEALPNAEVILKEDDFAQEFGNHWPALSKATHFHPKFGTWLRSDDYRLLEKTGSVYDSDLLRRLETTTASWDFKYLDQDEPWEDGQPATLKPGC